MSFPKSSRNSEFKHKITVILLYQNDGYSLVETEGIEASLRSFASQTFRILCRLRLCLTANRRNIDGGVRSPLAICKTNKKLQTFSFAVFLLVETEGIEPPTSRM